MKRVFAALLCAATLSAGLSGAARAEYPEQVVKVIVPFPTGQTTDIIARSIGQKLTVALGQSFYVDNRGGAGGIIGMEAGKRSPNDGYTLVFSSSGPLAINPGLYASLPYDTMRDFTAVSLIAAVPQFLVTRSDFPASNLKELIEYARKNPGKLNYGSGGAGLTNHLTMEMFKRQAGDLRIVHIPYRGAAAAMSSLMAGDISMMFESGPAVMPHVKSGALKVFAVGSKSGSRALPEVPSVDKAGVPGFDAQSWAALMVPAGVPRPIIEKLNKAVQAAMKDPAIQKQFGGLGAEMIFMNADESQAYVKSEIARWGSVIREANIKID